MSDLDRAAEEAARAAGGEYRPTYNGWPNRETWNAALWINNEEPMYHASRRIVADALADYEEPVLVAEIRRDEPPEERAAGRRRGALRDAADALSDWYAESIDAPTAGPLGDIVGYALACVDWYHIAENIADELPAEDDPDAATVDDTTEGWRP